MAFEGRMSMFFGKKNALESNFQKAVRKLFGFE
jgi:hypothetical protein